MVIDYETENVGYIVNFLSTCLLRNSYKRSPLRIHGVAVYHPVYAQAH